MSNLQTIKVGATTPARKTTMLISGTTHAAYIQKVNVRIQDANGHVTTHTFEGSGEGTSFTNPINMQNVPVPAELQFEFLYSSNGGGSFNPAPRSQQSELVNQPEIEVYSLFRRRNR